jgi:hypothetical protein
MDLRIGTRSEALRKARASLTWPLRLEAFMRLVAAVAILLALAFSAGAEDAKAEEKPDEKPVQEPTVAVLAFGVSHPECQEWTDSCVICARGADVVNCSTPGIACQPVETVCRRPAK